MSCPLVPFGEYVIVRPDAGEQVRAAGMVQCVIAAPTGIVAATGPDVLSGIEAGDRVFFNLGAHRYAVTIDGVEYLAVHRDAVFAKLAPARPPVPDGVPPGMGAP